MTQLVNNEKIRTAAVILSGGRGKRMGGSIPKQYMQVSGYPLIYYCLKTFEESFVDEIILVCGEGDEDYCREKIVKAYDFTKVTRVVKGGKERYHSVANGLAAIDKCDIVFIHDGARPFIDADTLKKALDETIIYKATVVAVPSKDTVKIADEDGFAISTPNRNSVWMMQTPQTFDYAEIRKAYELLIENEDAVKRQGITITDDAMVMEHFGSRSIKLVEGKYGNIKITTPEDMLTAEAYLKNNV